MATGMPRLWLLAVVDPDPRPVIVRDPPTHRGLRVPRRGGYAHGVRTAVAFRCLRLSQGFLKLDCLDDLDELRVLRGPDENVPVGLQDKLSELFGKVPGFGCNMRYTIYRLLRKSSPDSR